MRLVTIRSSSLLLPLACALASLAPLACTDGPVTPADASSGTTGMYVPPMPTTVETYNITMPPEDTTGVVPEPDVSSPYECNTLEQDCMPGEKCTLWSNDGHDYPNATKCVPVVREPALPGQRCHMEGWPASGIDDCDAASICWYVDSETLAGVCMPFCIGVADPHCEDRERFCPISANGLITLCVPLCNPIDQDCSAGQACIPHSDQWLCVSLASEDAGVYGDPCEFVNVCGPGLICIDAAVVPPGQPCEGAAGCCTEVCDLTDPLGDLQCAGSAEGQHCLPWYEEGKAPAGLEHVGVCAVPP